MDAAADFVVKIERDDNSGVDVENIYVTVIKEESNDFDDYGEQQAFIKMIDTDGRIKDEPAESNNIGVPDTYEMKVEQIDVDSATLPTNSEPKRSEWLCPFCKVYVQSEDRKLHIDFVHNIRPFGCSLCENQYKNANLLLIHLRKHGGIKSCRCGLCGDKFDMVRHLRKHVTSHESKMHACDCCDAKFHRNSDLKRHMRLHQPVALHTVPDTCKYTCAACGGRFLFKNHLEYHKCRYAQKSDSENTYCAISN